MTMVPVFCGRDCGGDACPLLAEVDEGRVLRIRHNPAAGEYVRGCPKGFALPHFHYSSERIKTPLVRSGPRGSGAFKSVSWDEALDRVRDGLLACAKRYGPQAVMSLSSAGSTGALHNTEKLTRRFLNAIGGCTVLDGNYSSNAAGFALRNAFGSDYANSGFDPATMDKSSMVILWGANILEARLAAELPARLLRASERGVPVISIDPRKTATTKRAKAEWIPVRPGTDAALMYAILDVLRRERLIDEQFVERRAEGFADLMDFVSGRLDGVEKSPAWAASLCGLEAEAIAALAKRW
ncbi:MAG: molybdopterin-dependent oxidoreductase, partial [Spirochaetales bacterium]